MMSKIQPMQLSHYCHAYCCDVKPAPLDEPIRSSGRLTFDRASELLSLLHTRRARRTVRSLLSA
jgi:hypothetical protein